MVYLLINYWVYLDDDYKWFNKGICVDLKNKVWSWGMLDQFSHKCHLKSIFCLSFFKENEEECCLLPIQTTKLKRTKENVLWLKYQYVDEDLVWPLYGVMNVAAYYVL
jgi:hypothetical protein